MNLSSKESNPKFNTRKESVYQIKIRGHLDSQWSDWFNGLSVTTDQEGNTLITGPVVDDSALHGLLKRIRDLGMPLISCNQIQSEEDDPYKKDRSEKEV